MLQAPIALLWENLSWRYWWEIDSYQTLPVVVLVAFWLQRPRLKFACAQIEMTLQGGTQRKLSDAIAFVNSYVVILGFSLSRKAECADRLGVSVQCKRAIDVKHLMVGSCSRDSGLRVDKAVSCSLISCNRIFSKFCL